MINSDEEAERTEGLALVWAWRYHHLQCRRFDSLEAAISSAVYAADDGDEALGCIEFFGQHGQRRTLDLAEARTLEDARRLEAERRHPRPKPRPVVACIYVRWPEEKQEVLLESFYEESEALSEFATLTPLGDRARLELHPTSPVEGKP